LTERIGPRILRLKPTLSPCPFNKTIIIPIKTSTESSLVKLQQALRDWSTDSFEQSLKTELMALDPDILPLQQGVTQGGYVDDSDLEFTLLEKSATPQQIVVTVGVFFSEIIAGCSCGDDPVAQHAYCQVCVHIDRRSAEAVFDLD